MGQYQAWALGRGLDDAVEPRWEFARSLPKGSGSSLGTSQEIANRKTRRKNVGGYQIGGTVELSVSDKCIIAAQDFEQLSATESLVP
ncbi:hypothetical protein B296_00003195 [Ensete ventricosum]|uniref:Uncharacterized protein n=1 Tax=Ensete ventricosum TaxID=4639 RepID=A0A427B2V2_ENSVE|nr:hypothetical protein B296_00003195 [Ensete ventricosum]